MNVVTQHNNARNIKNITRKVATLLGFALSYQFIYVITTDRSLFIQTEQHDGCHATSCQPSSLAVHFSPC